MSTPLLVYTVVTSAQCTRQQSSRRVAMMNMG